jgi:hypothetical protein
MEERRELPKQLSRRKKPGVQDSGSLRNVDPGPSWTLRIFRASVRTAFFKRNQLPWFNPSLNMKMSFIMLEKWIFFGDFKSLRSSKLQRSSLKSALKRSSDTLNLYGSHTQQEHAYRLLSCHRPMFWIGARAPAFAARLEDIEPITVAADGEQYPGSQATIKQLCPRSGCSFPG